MNTEEVGFRMLSIFDEESVRIDGDGSGARSTEARDRELRDQRLPCRHAGDGLMEEHVVSWTSGLRRWARWTCARRYAVGGRPIGWKYGWTKVHGPGEWWRVDYKGG
jgi:hypothetical protein